MSLLGRLHSRHVHSRRVRVLAAGAARLLPPEAVSVLDVGCGDGRFALTLAGLRPGLQVRGVDPLVRPDAQIPVERGDGARLPLPDGACDVVLLIDVLHHTEDPAGVLREAARVARRCVIVKDHLLEGFAARATLRFMDEVGNRRHGVALPHNYLDAPAWRTAFAAAGLVPRETDPLPRLYPWPASLVFGRGLHFLARLEPARAASLKPAPAS